MQSINIVLDTFHKYGVPVEHAAATEYAQLADEASQRGHITNRMFIEGLALDAAITRNLVTLAPCRERLRNMYTVAGVDGYFMASLPRAGNFVKWGHYADDGSLINGYVASISRGPFGTLEMPRAEFDERMHMQLRRKITLYVMRLRGIPGE